MQQANIKYVKKCAFCKHWYDPANTAVSPKAPQINVWLYDEKASRKCLKRNVEMKSGAVCRKYEGKIPVV